MTCHTNQTPEPQKDRKILAIIKDGLWKNNPTLVQVLGLCPTLAVTTSAVNAIGMGLATTVVLMLSNFCISAFRKVTPNEIRIPIYVLIIASLVTCIQLVMNAYLFNLYQSLGIFIALIVTNCFVVGRAEAFANQNPPLLSLLDGAMMGLGFTATLTVLGGIREILGQGTLFKGADLMFGAWAKVLEMHIYESDTTLLLAILPPGAFMVLGFLIALKNTINAKLARKKAPAVKVQVERARVTTF